MWSNKCWKEVLKWFDFDKFSVACYARFVAWLGDFEFNNCKLLMTMLGLRVYEL